MQHLQSVDSALDWMIDPISSDTFLSTYWESQPLTIVRDDPDHYASLLSLDQIDRVLADHSVRYPDIHLVNRKSEINKQDYAGNRGVIDVAKLYQLFFSGSTVILDSLHERIPALGELCRHLESQFCMPFQMNVYMTPPNAQGFPPHFDTHDVFVLQIAGSKHWSFYESNVPLPLSGQDFDESELDENSRSKEFDLHAGDMVYIPRGLVHDAQSTDEISLHITVGALAFTWTDFFLEAISEVCLNDENLRKSLPIGFARSDFDRSDAQRVFNELRARVIDAMDFDSTFDAFVTEMASSQRTNLRGQMQQLARLDEITENDFVDTQADLIVNFRQDAESIRVIFLDKEICFPARVAETVRFVFSQSRFKIGDLPGDLDAAGKLVLIKRLIKEGLVVVVREGEAPAETKTR